MSLLKIIKKYLANNRKGVIPKKINKIALELYQGYENLNYQFESNGESRVAKVVLDYNSRESTVFDVGANKGMWSKEIIKMSKKTNIHAFEIVPEVFDMCFENLMPYNGVLVNNFGLADESKNIDVYFSPKHIGKTTCVNNFFEKFHNCQANTIKSKVITGDQYCANKKISNIDLLKIDVEGFEGEVLNGFTEMFKHQNIQVVQFEYGYINIQQKFLLKDFYDFFEKFDFVIGKIYPNYVDFKDYKFQDENFFGPNYLAVKKSNKHLIKLLGN